MINCVQGTPGSGKSATAVAMAIKHLRQGGVVAANFSLVDGWSDVIAKQSFVNKIFDDRRYKKSSSLWERFFVVDSLDAIMKVKPKELSVDGWENNDDKYREGYGLLLLDEAQLIFNSRDWRGNFSWIEFFTQHRKLGWNVLLISHSIDMIDSQIRHLIEYESRYRNLQKVKFPILGFPLSPIPAFLVITRYAGLGAGASAVHSRELFPLPLWAARLYDTARVFARGQFDSSGADPEPRLCGSPPSPLLGGMTATASKRVKTSKLEGIYWDDYLMTWKQKGSV